MARFERPGAKSGALLLLAVRLILFVTAAAWVSRGFGTTAALAVLVGAIAARAVLLQRRKAP